MRLMITLQEREHSALWKIAEKERRDPRAHAALIIRHDLEERGLLPSDRPTAPPPAPAPAVRP